MATRHDVHFCPYCELRFSYLNEVKDHVLKEHPEHASSVLNIETIRLPRP
jgi:hypothetical protein